MDLNVCDHASTRRSVKAIGWAAIASAGSLSLTVGALAQVCDGEWTREQSIPGVTGWVNAMTMWDPDGSGPRTPVVLVGGSFTAAGGLPAASVATWDPATGEWSAVGAGVGGNAPSVRAVEALPDGTLVVGGSFSTAGAASAPNVARWDGRSWQPLGAGLVQGVWDFAVLPDGDLIAGGALFSVNGAPQNIARWNGVEWVSMGSGLPRDVFALAVLPTGELIAAGAYRNAAIWNGVEWTFPAPELNQDVRALAVLPDGSLVAAGSFTGTRTQPLNAVVTLKGSAWQAVGTGVVPDVRALVATRHGGLIAARNNGLGEWNGSVWTPIELGPLLNIRAMIAIDDVNLLVAGTEYSTSVLVRYRFHRRCPADFNCNRAADIPDIFEFVSAWFSRDAAADINGDGDVSVQDIFDFLASWFGGCD